MQLELRKFLTHLIPIRGWSQQIKDIFVRNRVLLEVKVLASYLYAQGLSLRGLMRLLRELGVRVSHVSIWKWVQKLGEKLKSVVFRRKKRRCLVVDETKIRTKSGWIYVFGAIDPENREIVGILATKYRESLDVLGFLKRCLRYCDGKPVIITDGGPWYPWPTRRLGLEHIVMCGGERNYIERWFETFKDRLRIFDCYFPTSGLESVENFVTVFCFWYNRCRWHASIRGPPDGGEGGLKTWIGVLS